VGFIAAVAVGATVLAGVTVNRLTAADAQIAAPPAASADRWVRLVTGDRVDVAANGTVVTVAAARRTQPVSFQQYTRNGRSYVIPADAAEPLRAGVIGGELFDVTALARGGRDAATAPGAPAVLRQHRDWSWSRLRRTLLPAGVAPPAPATGSVPLTLTLLDRTGAVAADAILLVQNLDVFDATYWGPAGPLTFPARVQPAAADIATLTVDSSTDDGRTWQPATVIRDGDHWTVSLRSVGPGYVSLRSRAADTAGNGVEEVVRRAYQVG
jgi:hypothetical protein